MSTLSRHDIWQTRGRLKTGQGLRVVMCQDTIFVAWRLFQSIDAFCAIDPDNYIKVVALCGEHHFETDHAIEIWPMDGCFNPHWLVGTFGGRIERIDILDPVVVDEQTQVPQGS